MLFNPLQLQTLNAAFNRIIPPDDYPGATEAGATEFLERLLQSDLEHLIPCYRQGLDGLETESQTRFESSFHLLADEDQDALLSDIELGKSQGEWRTPPAPFFQIIINHAAEGYYANPEQGGNRNCKSWEMIGFLKP